MWKSYSADYIKNNRASGISVMAAAFIAALFLSFLCSLFYNFWLDNIEGIKLSDGDWHGRITGEIGEGGLAELERFANVESAEVNEELSDGQQTTVDIRFFDKKSIYKDMSALTGALGLTEQAADYNYQLLSLYFIRVPGDEMPRMLMPAYLAIVLLVCFSLILVIHNSFAVSMNSRVRQLGILASIGAAPGQIRICLVQEALLLSAAPILAGILAGVLLSFGTVRAMGTMAAKLAGGRQMDFGWHPAIYALILLLAVGTVLISAWIPAARLARISPLEAIRSTKELQLKKKKRVFLLSLWFGIEGELAGNALKAQKKALRTTSLSLMLAFLGFMLMQCFFTLSGISTRHTYFEAFQDTWDVMVTVKDTGIERFEPVQKLQELPGAKSSVVYQKAEALCRLPKKEQSRELLALGGLEALGQHSADTKDTLLTEASLVILADESFAEFCMQAGIEARLDGVILWNRLWDSLHSNFRYRSYIPFVQEDLGSVTLQRARQEGEEGSDALVELPVLACTDELPVLREEFGKSGQPLVQFVPASLWRDIKRQVGGEEQDTYIRILAQKRDSLASLSALEQEALQAVGPKYETESENRMQEKLDNDKMLKGYELILGGFCALFAIIGVAHVFAAALGFLRQRKREFARYLSVGLTPEGMCRILGIEAVMVAGRPMLAALLCTAAATAVMIKASYLEPAEFIREAPILPIVLFVLAVFGFVALAYFLGGRKLLNMDLAQALRDDTLL